MTYGMFVTTQISMNVSQTTEVVALMPAALTMWAASRVPVYPGTPEMDSPVQVIYTSFYVMPIGSAKGNCLNCSWEDM